MNLPNKITVFRFCCIPFLMAFSLIEFKYHWVAALLVYFVACMSDKADGIIARKKGLVTDFGKVMDPLSDKTLVFCRLSCIYQNGLAYRTLYPSYACKGISRCRNKNACRRKR